MAYNHSYSNYVNHILNKSPSRTTYSFNKSERFKDNQSFDPQNDPFLLYNKKQSPGKVNNHFNNGYQIDQERQMHRKPTNMEFYNQRDLQRGKSKSVQSRKKGIKKTSPFKKYNNNVNEMNHRTQFYQKESSPYKKSPYKYSPSKNDSYKNSQRKKSPSKIYIQDLQEIDHPLKKMTIGGYYPTGVQLSPNGKYINSKIRNVSSYSFSKGSLGNRYDNSQNNQDPLGPGYYTAFSQFGQSRRR